jgi:hypothetical protein
MITVHGGITSVNSPLLQKAEMLDEILKYADIPPYVVQAYRNEVTKEAEAAKKKR